MNNIHVQPPRPLFIFCYPKDFYHVTHGYPMGYSLYQAQLPESLNDYHHPLYFVKAHVWALTSIFSSKEILIL